jgi:hypothetical protein
MALVVFKRSAQTLCGPIVVCHGLRCDPYFYERCARLTPVDDST